MIYNEKCWILIIFISKNHSAHVFGTLILKLVIFTLNWYKRFISLKCRTKDSKRMKCRFITLYYSTLFCNKLQNLKFTTVIRDIRKFFSRHCAKNQKFLDTKMIAMHNLRISLSNKAKTLKVSAKNIFRISTFFTKNYVWWPPKPNRSQRVRKD